MTINFLAEAEILDPESEYTKVYNKLYSCVKYIYDVDMKQKIIKMLYEITQLKNTASYSIYELIDVLNGVFNAFISWKNINSDASKNEDKIIHIEHVNILLTLAQHIDGKKSTKNKTLGIALMALAVIFVATAATLVVFGAMTIVPSAGSSALIAIFGFAPAIKGLTLFKFGYRTFKSGYQHGLSQQVSIFAQHVKKQRRIFGVVFLQPARTYRLKDTTLTSRR